MVNYMKKNIYLSQFNYLHGNSTFLPYAVGTLIANAKSIEEINDYFEFKDPFFLREKQSDLIKKIESPFLFGFSNYIWNHEYNKELAKKIKTIFPDCLILFGGHQISSDTELLEKESYIDFMIFGEGEDIFAELLLAIKNKKPLSQVSNIAYRENDSIIKTQTRIIERCDYPSPYLSGVFNSILHNNPDIDFHTIIETNRGCPYNCSYCDWGNLNSCFRLFPEEKVMDELQWLSDNNIRGFGCADANFGMFERDEKFVDEMVRLHNEFGVLSRFQVSSAKNSNDRVFRIAKKLNECGMDKGATLSFQSLNETVLENIHRKNIPVESFSELLKMYNQAGIPTYSELILGLPGETYESFIKGIDTLLEAGQHNSIYIHNCEWLPCAEMGNKDYIQKHGIEYVTIPLNEPHTLIDSDEEIIELSRLIVKTNTMSKDDWVKLNLYSAIIQCFHHEGLLMFFAIYLRYEKGIKYSDFYKSFINYIFQSKNGICRDLFQQLTNRFKAVSQGAGNNVVWVDLRFGNVGWTAEEYLFLNIAYEYDKFYNEIKDFLKSYFDDIQLFDNLFTFQKKTVKLPFQDKIEFDSGYNFKEYFYEILCGRYTLLKKEKCLNSISNPVRYNNWIDYARFVVWYGRKDSRNIYLDEIEINSNNKTD